MTPTRAGWDRLPVFQRRRQNLWLHILKHFFQMLVNTQVYSASTDKCPLLGMGMRDWATSSSKHFDRKWACKQNFQWAFCSHSKTIHNLQTGGRLPLKAVANFSSGLAAVRSSIKKLNNYSEEPEWVAFSMGVFLSGICAGSWQQSSSFSLGGSRIALHDSGPRILTILIWFIKMHLLPRIKCSPGHLRLPWGRVLCLLLVTSGNRARNTR